MFKNKFQAALKSTMETKDLDTLLVGSNANYLGEGSHDVIIKAIDLSKIEEKGYVKVTYEAENGKSHNDMVSLLDFNGDQLSFALRALWSAVIPSKEAMGQFLEELGDDNYEVFGGLSGLKCRITLGRGKGFICKATADGTFSAFDVETGDNLLDSTYEQLKEAQEQAEARGYKRSFIKVKRNEATHADTNIAAFNLAIEAMRKVKTSANGPKGSLAGASASRTANV